MKHLFIYALTLLSLNLYSQSIKISSDFQSGSFDSSIVIDSSDFFKISKNDSIRFYSLDIYSKADPKNPIDTLLASSARWYNLLITGAKDKFIFLNLHNTDSWRPFYSYDGKKYERFSLSESPEYGKVSKLFREDSVYISYFIPYDYNYLKSRINLWKESEFLEIGSVGYSNNGLDMPLLTITDKNIDDSSKKVVYIHGRIHTSENPASWHLDSMIEQLLDPINLHSEALRKNIIFYIVPFTNPDGVVEGLSRSNSNGVNIEINWGRSTEQTEKEVLNIKNFLSDILKKRDIDLFLNMHSQSSNQCTYWIHSAESTSIPYYNKAMRFAYLTTNNNPYFKKKDLLFSKVASRYLEGWFWNKTGGRTLALTFETPYTYYSEDLSGEWVNLKNLSSLATSSLLAIGDYLKVSSEDRKCFEVKDPLKKKLYIKLKDVKVGKYAIYGWGGDKGTEWEFLCDYNQKRDGNMRLKINNPAQNLTDILIKKL